MLRIADELEDAWQTHIQHQNTSVHRNVHLKSVLPWPVASLMLLSIILLFCQSALQPSNKSSNIVVACILLFLFGVNIFVAIWNNVKQSQELTTRISWLADIIRESHDDASTEEIMDDFVNYINSCESTSFLTGSSHSFTMVYRKLDDDPIPFPTSLIATGSIIGLSPGQPSPCETICALDGCITLHKGDIFYKDGLSRAHTNTQDHKFLNKFNVLESPIVGEIKESYMNSNDGSWFSDRPNTMLIKDRQETLLYIIIYLIPIVCLLTLSISTFWFVYCTNHDVNLNEANQTHYSLFMERNEANFWFETFFLSPVLIALPLLPILCPIIWMFLYAIGEAKSLAICFTNHKIYPSLSCDNFTQLPATTYSLVDIFQADQTKPITWLKLFPKVLFGDKRLLSRNAGTFDTLGSLTILCCVNKEGVLSWYDPAPEKVCFLSPAKTRPSNLENDDSVHSNDEASVLPPKQASSNENSPDCSLEIITLSQDAHNSNKLQFDDPDWSKHIASLKIIGLNILSACSMQSFKDDDDKDPLSLLVDPYKSICHPIMEEELKRFYDSHSGMSKFRDCGDTLNQHLIELEYISVQKNCLPPGILSSRSGLHCLAELTGFDEEISLLFLPKMVLTNYKKCSRLTRSVNRKNPPVSGSQLPDIFHANSFLSYAHGVVVSSWNDADQNHLLMFGSGDFVMQLSASYWDGVDVRSLNDIHVRKILDFHNRNMITGNCIAFSFRPLDKQFKLTESFVEEIDESDSSIPSDQIFLGMVSMQYQARIDVFHLIEALENACIRFVHFSNENEFRARVFAEKMGLEVGWNCHISLSHKKPGDPQSRSNSVHSHENPLLDEEIEVDIADHDDPSSPILAEHLSLTPTSESSFSDSAFHALNRAKLPRGVENIIPHIENVDNVPLLVPLFTDCEKKSTRKMIEIMQSYDEVVCCIGSSDTINNMTVFAQADVSIGLRPVLPFQSRDNTSTSFSFQQSPNLALNRRTQVIPTDSAETSNSDRITPCDNRVVLMARALNTFFCSVSLSGGDSLAVIYNMIKQAREFLFLTHISLILYMKCLLMIAIVQLISHLASFPLVFSPLDVVWLSYVIIPSVSFSILGSPPDSDFMMWASLKSTSRQASFLQLLKKNLNHFALKFLPSCLIVILLYSLCLVTSCKLVAQNVDEVIEASRNLTGDNVSISVKCYPQFSLLVANTTHYPTTYTAYMSRQKRFSQQICLCALVLYICVISSAYVHRWKLLIKCSPFSNVVWMLSVCFVLVVQFIYSTVVISTYGDVTEFETGFSFGSFQPWMWTIIFVWPLPCLLWNEVAKWKEIRMWSRSQKRARLAFGTKLGMNSPF